MTRTHSYLLQVKPFFTPTSFTCSINYTCELQRHESERSVVVLRRRQLSYRLVSSLRKPQNCLLWMRDSRGGAPRWHRFFFALVLDDATVHSQALAIAGE